MHAQVANYHHKNFPEFEDWGEANLLAENGATNYVRVDWLNPDGLRTWGDYEPTGSHYTAQFDG